VEQFAKLMKFFFEIKERLFAQKRAINQGKKIDSGSQANLSQVKSQNIIDKERI